MVFFYLLGTISTGYIFTQFVFNKKKISFRHTGASAIFEKTNFRTATVVILVDFIKGLCVGFFLIYLSTETSRIFHYCVISMIIGHVFPIQKTNQGGRGVIISAGILYSIITIPMLIGTIFIVMVKLLYKDSSLAVLLSMPLITTAVYFFPLNNHLYNSKELLLFLCLPIVIILSYKRVFHEKVIPKLITNKQFINRLFYDRD